MRLGLIGRGPQAQRYLMPNNGGAHVVSQIRGRVGAAEYQDWLQGVDGVIIATHPSGHRWLALDAIEEGKHVLIEKPLALSLEDCEEVIDAAERKGVNLLVAHTYLWTEALAFGMPVSDEVMAIASYHTHTRDYSPWLDWAPHCLAFAAKILPHATAKELVESCVVEQVDESEPVGLTIGDGNWLYESHQESSPRMSPMLRMVRSFMSRVSRPDYNFQRRVYRALFAQENHGTI